jgi:hypothetical protein
MSSIGSDPDEYTPGNQPDGSYYNLYPTSPEPGLFGGQYADMQANSPPTGMTGVGAAALGLNPDISGDDTGLPPSVTVAPNLPQQADPSSGGSITYKNTAAPPSDPVDYMLNCMTQYYGGPIRVSSTSDSHGPNDVHSQGLAADVTGDDPKSLMQAGANCGAAYQQDEYTHPSPNATGPHVHLQLRPGRSGATGPYYPLPNLTPWPTDQ